jgi:hypothetical protein
VVVVVEFAEPDGWSCAEDGVEDEPGLEGLVWVWVDGGFAVVLLGDCANAAVPRIRPRAVLTNNCLFISGLLSIETSRTTESPPAGSAFRNGYGEVTAGTVGPAEKAPTIACP